MPETWRPETLPMERVRRLGQNVFPTGLDGRSGVPSPMPDTFEAQKAAIAARSRITKSPIRHMAELLKSVGGVAQTTYRLQYRPISQPNWPQIFAGGVIQEPDVDYTVDGKIINVLSNMHLLDSETLYVDYNYIPEPAAQPTVLGTSTASGRNGTVNAPAGLLPGDFFVIGVLAQGLDAVFPSPPTGFDIYEAGVTGASRHRIYTKTADGSETAIFIPGGSTGLANRTFNAMITLRGPDLSVLDHAENAGTTSPGAIPTLTGFAPEEMALAIGFYSSGVVSGNSGGAYPAPYTNNIIGSAFEGKQGIVMATWIADADASPSGTRNFSGSLIAWHQDLLRVGG